MLLRSSIQKTKNFFKKTLQSLSSLFSGRYRNLSGTPILNPFHCIRSSPETLRTDEYYYKDLCNEWETNLETTKKENKRIAVALSEPLMEKATSVGTRRDKTKQEKISRALSPEQDVNSLAQKMKELEIADAGDVEHVLDVEEAIHYYSRLRSPVYLDMVDRFFTDMYSELTIAQATVKSSRRRFGSVMLKRGHKSS